MYSLDTILAALTKQRFADFYNEGGEFDRWITGEENAPSEEEVKALLRKILESVKHV